MCQNNSTFSDDGWTSGELLETIYLTSTFVLGLSGNLFFVITSHLYQSIDLDTVKIILVRQIAIADLLQIINTVLPTILTIFSIIRGWFLGDLLCDVTAHFNFIPVLVNNYLVLSLSLYKILACKMPVQMRKVKTSHVWLLVLSTYLLASVVFLESVFLGKNGILSSPVSQCLSKIYVTHPTLMLVTAIIFVGVPIVAIVVCNIWLYRFARRMVKDKGANSSSRALILICAVSGLFVVSWAPKLIYVIAVKITKKQTVWAVKLSHFAPFLSSAGNPIIYTFTNRRYGKFVYNLFANFKITTLETSTEVMSKLVADLKLRRPIGRFSKTSEYGGEVCLEVREENCQISGFTSLLETNHEDGITCDPFEVEVAEVETDDNLGREA